MAVAYVRDTGRITGGGVDSASGSFAALPAAGNAVQVLYSVWRSGGATVSAGGITDNQSNTYSKADEGAIGSICAGIFYDEDIGSPSGTFTVTINPDLASAYIEAVAIEVSGVADSSSLDQHNNATGNSSTPTVTSGTTAQADEFAVGALVVDDGSDAGIDTAAGWTTAHLHQSSGDTISAYQAYKVLSATGTQTFDGGTLSSSVNWAIVVATFKGAASGSATLTAAQGSFALSGQAATFAIKETAAQGSYALSGEAAAFGVKLTAAQGSHSLSGQAASFAGQLTAAHGSYVLAGQDANLVAQADVSLTAQTGIYTLLGEEARFSFTENQASGGITRGERESTKERAERIRRSRVSLGILPPVKEIIEQQAIHEAARPQRRRPAVLANDLKRALAKQDFQYQTLYFAVLKAELQRLLIEDQEAIGFLLEHI